MSFYGNPKDVDQAITAIRSVGMKVPDGLVRLHLAAIVDAALHPNDPKQPPSSGELAKTWGWAKTSVYRLLCAWEAWCPKHQRASFAPIASRWSGGTILERARNDDGTAAERQRNDTAGLNADNGEKVERQRNDDGTASERQRNENGPARGSHTVYVPTSVPTSVSNTDAPPDAGAAGLVSELDAEPDSGKRKRKSSTGLDPKVAAVWDVYREHHPRCGAQPAKSWGVAARVAEWSPEAVAGVIRWAHESRHQRAVYLRTNNYLHQTLFREGTFGTYLEFAEAEGFTAHAGGKAAPGRPGAPGASLPPHETAEAAGAAWEAWRMHVRSTEDAELFDLYTDGCRALSIAADGGLVVDAGPYAYASHMADNYDGVVVQHDGLRVYVRSWVGGDRPPEPTPIPIAHKEAPPCH